MKSIPNTWLNGVVSKKIDVEAGRTKYFKVELAKRFDAKNLEGVVSDFNDATITEYLSAEISKFSNPGVQDFSPILQSLISYRISLYDFIEDKHYYKCGKETILKTKGENHLKLVMSKYELMSEYIASKIEELGIKDAIKFSNKQYGDIILGDKKRNSGIISSPSEAIAIQESLAGNPARYLAYLSGGSEETQSSIASLVNSMCTIEDLMHLLTKDDIKDPKSTIPLAFLQEEIPNFTLVPQAELKKQEGWYHAIESTKEYIQKQLLDFEKKDSNNTGSSLIQFSECIKSFIKDYIPYR